MWKRIVLLRSYEHNVLLSSAVASKKNFAPKLPGARWSEKLPRPRKKAHDGGSTSWGCRCRCGRRLFRMGQKEAAEHAAHPHSLFHPHFRPNSHLW